jgi:hypothetical protein
MNMSSLPMNTFSEIPTPRNDAKKITGLVKHRGRITGYQLSDGQILNKQEGISLARQGGIQGVGISERKGSEYLKSLPDGSEANTLSSLPAVSHNQLS